MTMDLAKQLQTGIQQLGLNLSQPQQQKLLAYLELLTKWNAAYNLTAIREPEAMLVQHLLDSLSIWSHLPFGKILDVGTGAGLPGIPLALAMPDREFTLLDSNGKKCRFLIHVKHQLQLDNVTVTQTRVEQFQGQFDGIVSRAFATIIDMLQNTEYLCSNRGVFLAMKGNYPATEIAEIPRHFSLQQVVKLTVPYLAAERHLVIIGK